MRFLFVVLSLFSLKLCSAERTTKFDLARLREGDCSSAWEEYSSKPNKEIALPDTNVTYWRYRFLLKKDSPLSLKISGQFPHSRYMAFTLYRQDTMDIASNLTDRDVVPLPGNLNPFLPKVPRDVPNRSYAITVLPLAHAKAGNNLNFPEWGEAEATMPIDIWYRMYLPDQNAYPNGAVELPKIEAFNPNTNEKIACPERAALPFAPWKWVGKLPPKSEKNKITFYKPKANGIYSNKDTSYIGARPYSFSEEEVAVFRFKAPKTPMTYQGGGAFTGEEEIRYWSLCYSSILTTTAACFSDGRITNPGREQVTLVLATEDMKASALSKGYEFLAKEKNIFPIFLYRNLLAKEGFQGALAKVAHLPLEASFEPEKYQAQNYIGEYAPEGVICSKQQFEENGCPLE